MRRFIWLLLVLVISVWLGLQIAKDPGLAFFSYRDWSVEMPLWAALVGLFIILFLFYLIIDLFGGIDNIFYRIGRWLRGRQKARSYSKTTRGLIALIEGQWKKAEKCLLAGIQQSDTPLINYLALAKAAHEQAAYDRQEIYLQDAHRVTAHAEIAVGLMQAQFQIEQGQFEQALATLMHLQAREPSHSLVLKLLERVYVHLGDWNQVLKLLPSLYKSNALTSDQFELLEQTTYIQLLKATMNHPEGIAELRAVWNRMPRKLQKNPQLLGCYAQQLMFYPGETIDVIDLLNKSLKKSWNADLIKLYGLINTIDPIQQLVTAERWVTLYPNQALLFLTLGRLSMRCQLWGKARSYFEKSLALEESAIAYFEYGKLLEQLGETSTAYRDGLVFLLNREAHFVLASVNRDG